EADPYGVEIHAFVSQGFIKTTNNNYLASSERGSFEFTEVGLNVTKQLTDELRVGVQLFAQDLGPSGNYAPRMDWYYLDYRFFDWFGIRAGRTKIPFGLYNEFNDIDAARVPILLPQSVYPIDHRDFLLAQTGGELYGNVPLGTLGTLEYRAYGGTLHIDTPPPPSPGIEVEDAEVPYVFGGRVMWAPPITGLQIGASAQALRFDWDYQIDPVLIPILQGVTLLPADFANPLAVKFRVKLWVASLEYQRGDLLFSAEYSRWIGEFESVAPKLLAPKTVNERYYAMLSYRVAPWFTPGVYFSVYLPNVDERDARKDYQRDLALSFRYDLNPHWLLKIEGHYMNGTAALAPALNDGTAVQKLSKDWGVLVLKTTAYF
ncbi:MAG TPA: porin, partial [Polyangiaceae bacterium]|nr:porin [Polyangiaceae bacterium]